MLMELVALQQPGDGFISMHVELDGLRKAIFG